MVQRPVDIRHVLSICLVLPACFHPQYNRPACGPGGECPDGLTCRGQVCESGPGPADASIDASVDAAPDAGFCFGTFARICLQRMPSSPLTLSLPTMIDTGSSPICGALSGGPDVCVLAATTLTVEATLRATGPKPFVLLATDAIMINGSVDVASRRGATPEIGAGADFGGCLPGVAPASGGGGAGGSFVGLGGNGGNSASGGSGGQVAPGASRPTVLRGGCPGQDGVGANPGIRGHGGGAILLIAGTSITHVGSILAAGEGGRGGDTNASGAGGGGSGGMIVLDAATILGSGLILANGGGGGEGSGNSTPGNAGADPSGTVPATGGGGSNLTGGDGGDGSGPTGAAAANGNHGTPTPAPGGGGGGGGGGAGIVRARPGQDLGPDVSPAVTVF